MLLNREEEGIDIPDLDWIKWMARVEKNGDIIKHIFIYILYKLEFSFLQHHGVQLWRDSMYTHCLI